MIAFVEKPPPGKAPSNWINAGTYVLEPRFLDRIPPRLNVSVERETFPRMLAEPGGLFGFTADGYWLDIGTPEKYLQAHADVLAGRLGAPPAPGARQVSPGVWVQGDVDDRRRRRGRSHRCCSAPARGSRQVRGCDARCSAAGTVVEATRSVDRAVLHDGSASRHGSTRASVDRRPRRRARSPSRGATPRRSSAPASTIARGHAHLGRSASRPSATGRGSVPR